MAASPPSDVCLENTDHSTMETDECTAEENKGGPENKTFKKNDPEKEDTFKKPALFAVPSLTIKRSNAAPSKPAAAEIKHVKEENEARDVDTESAYSSGVVIDIKTTEKSQEEEKKCAKDKSVAPVKPKQEAKPRVLQSAKGPPVGKFPPIPYTEPLWGGTAPDTPYALEILKNGTIIDTVPLTDKSYIVVGRLPVCDVPLDHPSISRYHAIIQYRREQGEGESVGEERGFYVHDLGSTHGTVVNKNKIPPKTFIRIRVGHVLKFGGSTRLFILQGPEFDEEKESELTVTELRERGRKRREELEKRMTGDGSDDDDEKEEDGQSEGSKVPGKPSNDESGCSWGMGEEAAPEEDENEENPFSTEFQEDQEAAYLKDPKKALQGFYDREGEELEFEYEDQSHGSWLCRIQLPVDDAMGRQLVAEVTHTGKKKDAAIQCCLDACRMLEARGLLRQEAVSRKRKKKNWEDEDFYDSDDDNFLDRTGTVDERPETYESLVSKLSEVEKELAETQRKLSGGKGDSSGPSSDDPLDAFMTAVRSEVAMDAVERRKLHVHSADLRKEVQRLRKLVELTRPAQMPSLLPGGSSEPEKPKKSLPMFGAMKGGSKFRLKTGTIGKLPPKRPNLPAELFNMKELPPKSEASTSLQKTQKRRSQEPKEPGRKPRKSEECDEVEKKGPQAETPMSPGRDGEPVAQPRKNVKKKVMGPSRPPKQLSEKYPEDDPDYCVWLPPTGQSGDGRTHLNDKFGY
ncbi:hypothetical protein JOQ06_028793 [Pogonophryne albipinna]|uniref:FHA domain-containing protein n=1 Tax=Pogonophryne albipinna TaxID=1090488 RepID=A0AAD6FN87_9TELE|nr:hypothetical protein JOQ06_028793 [Pogonophryne albipinna]